MNSIERTKKGDFVEIKYTGYANNEMFDSNIESQVKKTNPEAKETKTIVCIGQSMVVKGLDSALIDKELNKQYEITMSPEEGFGKRNRELIKTIPLSLFTKQKITPKAGMMFTLDNSLVKIITISGARVITDFNNPLAGKEIKYEFKIIRIVKDDKEKIGSLFLTWFKFTPKFEVKDSKVVIDAPKEMEIFINVFKNKFKELIDKDLEVKVIEPKLQKEESREKQKKGANKPPA